MTKETASEALGINVNHDINAQLHDAFTVRYSCEPADNIIHDITNISTNSFHAEQIFETWDGVQNTGNSLNDWQIFHNDQYLCASVPLLLLQHLNIEQAAEKAYTMIFQLMTEWDYPFLIRTWNFFNAITDDVYSGFNNYQLFCSGRSRAYNQHTLVSQPYPAATVIGTSNDELCIYFIAAKTAGIGIENTKQVSAFQYPSSYSEDPPLFSRALLHRNSQQQLLFISGTASITGHNTQFEGDVSRQTEVCLDNIQQLISTAYTEHQFANISLTDLSQVKVFIKHSQHLDSVQTVIQHSIGISAPVIYLQGDMCRSDLLVEIEAIAISPII